MRKVVSVVTIILAIAVIFGIIYVAYSSQINPARTATVLYNHTVYVDNVATDTLHVYQGLTQRLNLTLTAYEFSPSIAVPIDNIKLTAYNSTIDYSDSWDTSNWNNSFVQSSVFNYSIGLNTLTLQPNKSTSTIITINWADNAPAGRYTAEINLGDFKFLSPQGKYDQYGSSIWLGIVVTPE